MEFNEKLQELRKNKGLTQDELAESLFVSRAAVSKWEQGRGYPSIDSLRDISRFFSVSIDDLLSSEKLLSIAEKENKANIRKMCDLLLGISDLFSLAMIVLPLYPNVVDGFVYSVSLIRYAQATALNKTVYWITFILLLLCGFVKLLIMKGGKGKDNRVLTTLSICVNAFAVLFLAVAREAYAAVLAFFMLVLKGVIILIEAKNRVNIDKS